MDSPVSGDSDGDFVSCLIIRHHNEDMVSLSYQFSAHRNDVVVFSSGIHQICDFHNN